MSYQFEAYYALHPIHPNTWSFLEEEYEIEPPEDESLGGICVDSNALLGDKIQTPLLSQLSHQSSALYLAAFSSGNLFYFQYWKNGTLQRSLKFEVDSGWLEVQGDALAWETPAFFKKSGQFNSYLNSLANELGSEDPEYLRTSQQLLRIQQDQLVEVGAFLPNIDPELTAIEVFNYYHIQLPFA